MAVRLIVALLALAPVASAPAAEDQASAALLAQLKADLETARAYPTGYRTQYRCPEGLMVLKGMALRTVQAALPAPDWQYFGTLTYFLASPRPKSERGGGFPQIRVTSDLATGNVVGVSCAYAR
jgi:hypothetical protein